MSNRRIREAGLLRLVLAPVPTITTTLTPPNETVFNHSEPPPVPSSG